MQGVFASVGFIRNVWGGAACGPGERRPLRGRRLGSLEAWRLGWRRWGPSPHAPGRSGGAGGAGDSGTPGKRATDEALSKPPTMVSGESLSAKTQRAARDWALRRSALRASLSCPSLAALSFSPLASCVRQHAPNCNQSAQSAVSPAARRRCRRFTRYRSAPDGATSETLSKLPSLQASNLPVSRKGAGGRRGSSPPDRPHPLRLRGKGGAFAAKLPRFLRGAVLVE